MKVLRIEPFSGIAGDMFVAAAAQLVGDEASLPQALGLEGVELRFSTVHRGGLEAQRLEVLAGGEPAERAAAGHSHRHLSELLALVERAELSAPVRQRTVALLTRLGEAEAAVHGVPFDRVHLHEAGGVDSLVDIVAAAWLIERLAVDLVICEPVCTGFGTVHTAHGELPIPAPATERLLRGMPTVAGEIEGEMTTPTGATILAALEPAFERPSLRVTATAYGAGSRDLPGRPNVLRLTLGETADDDKPVATEELVLLSTAIDDMSGELFGDHLIAALLERGALDAVLRPVLMKKGRPGVEIEVLCRPERRADLGAYLLENTTTLGVRWHPVRRQALPRERVELETRFGPIGAKRAQLPSGAARTVPEFEDCRVAAERAGVPVLDIYQAAVAAAVEDHSPEDSE